MSGEGAARHVLAVDIGGTKLSAAVVDGEGSIVSAQKTAAERSGIDALTKQIVTIVSDTIAAGGLKRSDVKAAGVIVPGIYYAETGNVWVPNLWGHVKVPFRNELETALAMRVVMDSDRAGCVLGEQWLGAAKGVENVIFLSVGTGIGAGIISGGRVLRGGGDIAGAVGWFALTTKHCERYRDLGCWEAEAAGPALARRTGADSAEQVIRAARAGDAAACESVAETARYLGLGIANLVSVLNPEMIVLGGGLMQAHDLFFEEICSTVAKWAQPEAARQVRIVATQLGDNAGLLGAARLAFEHKKFQH